MKTLLTPLAAAIALLAIGSASAQSVTFYQGDDFNGRQFTATRAVENFDRSGFNDQVKSAVVHDGGWEICVDADFSGGCSVLAPGSYPTLGAYAGRVSSIRPVGERFSDQRSNDRGRNQEGHATLYEGRNLSGRAFSLNETLQNLVATGFNDRASSLRVDSGYWIFCSDAEFQGECRTFGPGDYASLPGMNNAISSGRRISNQYPYEGRPDWQGDSYRQSQGYRARPQ
ncbi:MAG: beta/gamma crystallin family protein [Betaproteobacteria bacterium]|nr:beta/gamma crystallin family protein [Betaproteobacteria bacterium]